MAGKRKTKTTKQKESMGPSKWRLQHGGFSDPIREADPENGTPVAVEGGPISGHLHAIRRRIQSPTIQRRTWL